MAEPLISQQFIDSADLIYQWAPALARPIESGVQALLACVTGGGKILLCGNGAAGALAQYAAALLIGGLERARPELPALALGTDAVMLTAVARRGEYVDSIAAQVRALGSVGDALVVLSSNGQSANLIRAAQAAHERDMTVIALTGRGGGELARQLRDTDVLIAVPPEHGRIAHIHAAHLLAINGLCEGLDDQLLGNEENRI
ncbi:MAG: SIS domain-containing protein [Burkholderiaceae bacterium]|jgi:D-sedoheptulose 7-phosphate isomerase|nr:SIS domain-containing protein [Burkholderiaceae bacterium]